MLCSLGTGIQNGVAVGTARSLPASSFHSLEGLAVPEHQTLSRPVVLGHCLRGTAVCHRRGRAGHGTQGHGTRVLLPEWGAPWQGLGPRLSQRQDAAA